MKQVFDPEKFRYMVELSQDEMQILSASSFVSTVAMVHSEFFDMLPDDKFKREYAAAMLVLLDKKQKWGRLVQRLGDMS